MPQLVITEAAVSGLERCRLHLAEKSPAAAARAAQSIRERFTLLETEPEAGRPLSDLPKLRELIIPFGDTGYIALYRFERADDSVVVLAFRHQKEAGY